MKVHQLMSRELVACPRTSSLMEAARAMWNEAVRLVLIVEPDSGALLGVVTDRDICMAAMSKRKPLHEISVDEVMRKHVYACAKSDDVARVHSLMRHHNLHHVPVVDDENRAVGVIAMGDLARHANTTTSKDARDAFIQTIGTVSEPRVLMRKLSRGPKPKLEVAEAW